MAANIHDVAKRLRLSITTVSRALDGYDDVAESTRQRVIDTARELGYVPSRAARQLRRRRADAIGYILPTSEPRFSDPFYADFIAGMGDEAARHGFDVLVATAPPGDTSERALYERWIQSRRVDGVVLNRVRRLDWRVGYLASEGIPFATLGKSLDPVTHPYIDVDATAGFAQLVSHLADRGHRRIAFVGASSDLVLQSARLEGYRRGLARAGLVFDPLLIAEGDLTPRGGFSAAQALLSLEDPPTAIIGINDLTAIGALHAGQAAGLMIGRDLAIAGYDGLNETVHTQPPLTTLSQPLYGIARRLVEMVIRLITNKPLEEEHVILQPELLIRGSTG